MDYIWTMKFSKSHRKNMSVSAKARCSPEWRQNQSNQKRTIIDDGWLIRLYESRHTQLECALIMGVGRKVIANAMRRLNVKPRPAIKRNQCGSLNPNWHGKNATRASKHKRLYRAFGQPKMCSICHTNDPKRTYDWANLTGDYDDPRDYARMCRSCHWKYDRKHLNFKGKQCTTF